jgi:hypothetical protein
MPLTTTNWVSVDGVMQGLGAEDEDRRGGFERGGWAMPFADPTVEEALNAVYERAEAFLLGAGRSTSLPGRGRAARDDGLPDRPGVELQTQVRRVPHPDYPRLGQRPP